MGHNKDSSAQPPRVAKIPGKRPASINNATVGVFAQVPGQNLKFLKMKMIKQMDLSGISWEMKKMPVPAQSSDRTQSVRTCRAMSQFVS